MIRFIDLRGQSTGFRFAFFYTVTDTFLEFSNNQAWKTKHDFINDYSELQLDRFLNLMPEWAESEFNQSDF